MKKTLDILFRDCKDTTEKVCVSVVLVALLSIIPGVIAEHSVACAVMSVGYEIAFLGWSVNWVDKNCKEEGE